jgi:hypothetical protein
MDTQTCGVAAKTLTTAEWLAKHRNHGDLGQAPHPDGDWYYLVCECGAKHLTSRERASA